MLSSVAWDFRLEFVLRGNVKQIVSLLNALIRDKFQMLKDCLCFVSWKMKESETSDSFQKNKSFI